MLMQLLFIVFCAMAILPVQLMMAIPVYPACKRKGLSPAKWALLSIIPFVGIAITVHILAQKDL